MLEHLYLEIKGQETRVQQIASFTPSKTNMEPKIGGLWMFPPFPKRVYSGSMLNFGGCTPFPQVVKKEC